VIIIIIIIIITALSVNVVTFNNIM